MYITYTTMTGEPIRKHNTAPKAEIALYCLRFRHWETANAAWVADATVYQAISAFGGIEIYNAIPQH